MPQPLSAVLITKNARSQLGACLESLDFCDEIVVVDCGSDDGTVELAREAGARVIFQSWLGYGAQKQFAVEQARNDWVLCVDSDERISPELRSSIVSALNSPLAKVFAMPRRNRFLGRWLHHGEGYPDVSIRMFRRDSARWSSDVVHERVVTGNSVIERLNGDLLHESAESLESYLGKQNVYTSLQAAQMHAERKVSGVLDLIVSPLLRFIKFYFFRLGFLDGLPGFIHTAIGCMNSFNKHAKLIALNRNAGK
jgi:glycosyltransferase involved in cell wall biosynthesis